MKTTRLLIISTCVVAGGVIKERGQYHEPKSEQETYDLVRAGRALDVNDPDSKDAIAEIEKEKAVVAKPVVAKPVVVKPVA